MKKIRNPLKYLFLYIFVSVLLWTTQEQVPFEIGYGFFVITIAYLYFFAGGALGLHLFKKNENVYFSNEKPHPWLNKFVKIALLIDVVVIVILSLKFWVVIQDFNTILDYRISLFKSDALKEYYGSFAAYLFIYATIIPLFGVSFGIYKRITTGKSKILYLSALLLVAKESLLISRYYIFPVILTIFILLYCYDKKVTTKKIILLVSLFFLFMISAFIFRGEGDINANLNNARNYLVVGYSLFSRAIENRAEYNEFYDLSSPFLFLGTIGSKMFNQAPFFDKVQDFITFKGDNSFNAFYTSFLVPFLYVGAIGLSLLSFIFGVVVSYSHCKLSLNFTFLNLNTVYAFIILFFSHQFLPVQLSFFWDYFIISISVHMLVFLVNKKWRRF
ncbi:O-antigen polymerase [Pseudescherichia sp.]|uniref:O-antigen polymerase n=1 Tax=Pseudescherichia sp. TaxID=2055881 RepID=UPI00289721C3|nr:O-antigen polymerase [Pseudescherichia sp.]